MIRRKTREIPANPPPVPLGHRWLTLFDVHAEFKRHRVDSNNPAFQIVWKMFLDTEEAMNKEKAV